ncbi:MAG TPA: alpha/beta hydrolase [Candidatus Tumulicola sp.]|nr:alpha/beta hydrolase [Candidatus Tumulicola sp.]
MPSLGAHALRVVMRMTARLPAVRKIHGPHLLHNYRRVIRRGELLFGRLPRGLAHVAVDDAGVRGEWIFRGTDPDAPVVIYYLHGCGYVAGSPSTYRTLTGTFSRRCGARVFALDYRLAPEHRFPAALHDAIAGYRWLLASGVSPRRVIVAGDSAGGGLAVSTLLALRDQGVALPAGAVLIAPWVDLAARRDLVTAGTGSRRMAEAYLGDLPLDDPLASGLYADLTGLPPLMIQASTIEMLRDDAVRLDAKARAAGVQSTLLLWEGVPHVWHIFAGLRESREAFGAIAAFVERVAS